MEISPTRCICDRPTRGGPETSCMLDRCKVCGGYYAEPMDDAEDRTEPKCPYCGAGRKEICVPGYWQFKCQCDIKHKDDENKFILDVEGNALPWVEATKAEAQYLIDEYGCKDGDAVGKQNAAKRFCQIYDWGKPLPEVCSEICEFYESPECLKAEPQKERAPTFMELNRFLHDKDQVIRTMEGDIILLQTKLDAAREKIKELKDGWEEPEHFSEDI